MSDATPRTPVLYVEDDPLVAALVQQALADTCDVAVESDGFRALDRGAAAPPALLLVDLHLPKVDGFEVIRRWRRIASLADVPVVVITARVLGDEARQARALGCAAFLEKPFTLEALRATVAEALTAAGRAPDPTDTDSP